MARGLSCLTLGSRLPTQKQALQGSAEVAPSGGALGGRPVLYHTDLRCRTYTEAASSCLDGASIRHNYL